MIAQQPSLTRRKVLVGLLAAGAAATAAVARPTKPLDYLGEEALEDVIPKRIGRWEYATASGLVVPPEDELSQVLYSQLVTRVYTDGQNPPIMLLIAYSAGQTGILQIHRPEVCYPVGGFQLSPIIMDPIRVGQSIVPTNRLTATAESMTEHILYWTRVGSDMPVSWRDQRIAVAVANLRGIIPDAALIRISTRRSNGALAQASLEQFARDLITTLPPNRRSVLVAA